MKTSEFLAKVSTFADEYAMLAPGRKILCALSGGADSVVMVHSLLQLSKERGFTLCAAHYNHHLRGEEADRDAQFAQEFCADFGVPFLLGEGDVAAAAAAKGKTSGRGIEEVARGMRYAFLEDAAAHFQADRIATAHNADDNIETMVLHLVRGTGLQGLTGIPPVRGRIMRPFLTVSRPEVEEYLKKNELPHMEDSSNQDISFARNRMRKMVIPLLRSFNANLTVSMTKSIASLRQDQHYLTARALEVSRLAVPAEEGRVIATKELANKPPAVAARAVMQILDEIEAPTCTSAHVNSVLALARGESPAGALHLPGGVVVHRVYGDILFAWYSDPLPNFDEVPVTGEGDVVVSALGLTLVRREGVICPAEPVDNENGFYMITEGLPPMVIRPRRTGDTIQLPGRPTKTIKKLFIEVRIPRHRRERIAILATVEGEVLAIAGQGPARPRLAKPGQKCTYFQWVSHQREAEKAAQASKEAAEKDGQPAADQVDAPHEEA